MKNFYFILLLLLNISVFSQINIINAGATWKYLDNGSDLGVSYASNNFNDLNWASGTAELGYGDGDESTVVSYGQSSSSKHITTYFRKNFTVNNLAQITQLNLELIRDDGVVVYINGTEVLRNNMPQGQINYLTPASSAIAWPNEDDWQIFTLSPLVLLNGNNTIAVEIHQDSPSSSDISFNLKLVGSTQTLISNINRGPYLNLGTSNSVIIKWRTDVATDSKVQFGTSLGNLSQTAYNIQVTNNHEVKIQNLNPSSRYFYKVGNSSGILTTESTDVYFKTGPLEGSKDEYRFWVIGDAGTGNNNQRSVRDAFMNYNANKHIDGWIWLGDNAYEGGSDSEYQSNVFSNNTYENELKKIIVWPALGNHDYNNNIPFSPDPAYFDIFSLPMSAEAGGLASGTEKYYSYNYGNIHFIVLDSYDESRSANGQMAQWLQTDLSLNSLPWIVAYWHHPPYTKGSHDSDNGLLYDWELVEMRQNIIPILESGGVDLVLCGHSHAYERSFLIDSHYGNSSSLNSSMIMDSTGGNYPASCPYQKNTTISNSHKGTVYAVVGCSGKLSGTSSGWPHPIMHKATNQELGSMLLTIHDNRLDAKFIKNNTMVTDSFTIVKNAGKKFDFNFCIGDTFTLKPSWPHQTIWYPNNIIADSLVVSPISTITYFAHDEINCITDTFNLILGNPALPCNTVNIYLQESPSLQLYPIPIFKNINDKLNLVTNKFDKYSLELKEISGKTLIQTEFNDTNYQLDVNSLNQGLYIIQIKSSSFQILKKLIIQ
jgi:hypothetical protein